MQINKKTKSAFIFVAIALVAVMVMGDGNLFMISEGLKPSIVYEPEYGTGRCQLAQSDVSVTDGVIDSSDALKTKVYGSALWGYTTVLEIQCIINTDKCKATTEQFDYGTMARAKCPLNAVITSESDLQAKCSNYQPNKGAGIWSSNSYAVYDFNINNIEYTNYEKLVMVHGGKPKVGAFITTVKADRFDLQSMGTNHLLTTASGTCNLKDLNQETNIDQKERELMKKEGRLTGFDNVPFTKSFSYIAGMKQTLDSVNIIQRSGSSEWVYIQSVGKVCPLEKTKTGLIYANCQVPISAPEIICIPFQPAGNQQCSQDGTKWVAELTCNSYGAGVPAGQVKVNNQLCEATCTSGVIKYINCKTIITCPEGSQYDYTQNKCISSGGVITPPTDGCKVDSDCNDDKFWTSDTCEKSGIIFKSEVGQCNNKDNSGYYYIIGAIIIGVMFVSTAAVVSGGKKKR